MNRLNIAFVEPPDSQEPYFTQYLEENGMSVMRLSPDRMLLKALDSEAVTLVVARSGPGETETLRATTVACKRINKPLILVAREGSDVERILYLRMGADDVLTPPYSMEELVLRVRALARRCNGAHRSERITWVLGSEELALDQEKHYATLNGKQLSLTEAQWSILCFLAECGDAAVSRRRLMQKCLSYSDEIYDRAVDTHIKNLRAKLGKEGWIETVRGFGYRFSWEARKL